MIFIYNRDEEQVDILDIDPIITEEIGKLRSLEFESEKEYEKGYRVVAKTEDGLFEFVIIDSEYQRDNIKIHTYFCQDSLIELQSIPILDKRPWGNIEVALKSILDSTRWVLEVRNGYNLTTVLRSSFYRVSALEAFSEIVEKYRSEWITEYKSVGNKITERRLVIYQRDGRSNGRLEFGKNIINFKRTILSEPIVTAIYPYGKGEDLGDGNYGRRISIEDVNNGIPYIENKQATEMYGLGSSGNKKPLFAFLILEDVEDKNELKKLAQEELDIVSGIRAEHTVDAADIDIEAKIGYEVPVIDEEIGYRAYARIIKIVRQGKDVQLTFGTVTKKFVDSFQKSISKTNKAINDVYIQINNVRASANGKTTVFTGPTEPTLSNEGDLWYRENADGTVDMLLFKNGLWVEELSNGVFKELRADIEANNQLVVEAKTVGDQALAEGQAAKAIGEEAQRLANEAQTLVTTKTGEISTQITAIESDISDNYGELTGNIADLNTALADKPDKIYVDQTIDEKTGTITQTIGQIETKVNELDAVPVYTIGADGYWYKDGVKTSTLAVGKDGQSGVDGTNFSWNMIKGSFKLEHRDMPSAYNDATYINNADGSITYQTNTTILEYATINMNGLNPTPIGLTEADLNKDIVFSVEAKTDSLTILSTYTGFTLGRYNLFNEVEKAVGKWHRIWFTNKISDVKDLFWHFSNSTPNSNVQLRNPMLHFGTIPAPYAPHITEIQGADGKDAMFIGATPPTDTTIAWLDTNTNSVKRWYNGVWYDINSEIKTNINMLSDTVNEHKQTIGQVTTDLKNKLDTSTFTTFKQGYDTVVSTVQKTETDLSQLSVGGRNLILESGISTQVDSMDTNVGASFTNNADGTATIKTSGSLINWAAIKINGKNPALSSLTTNDIGKEVILSWDLKVSKVGIIRIFTDNSGTYMPVENLENCVGKWGRAYVKWKVGSNLTINFHFATNETDIEIQLGKYPKLEFGNKPTDWTPAVEDVTTTLAFNTFKQTIDETVSLIKDKTSGLFSAITQKPGEIFLQAGTDTKNSVIHLTEENVFIDDALIKTAQIEDAAITNAKIGNLAVESAKIADLAVSTGKIADLAVSEAKIDNAAITTAKIGDAAIETAKIADLAVTSGKILNLDVLKISGLTSEFVQSKWNAINSSVKIDGNGMYIDGDWGGAINFTRRGLTYYDKIKGQVMGYQYGLYRNLDDPLRNSQMLGVFLGAEMGYDLRLGIRKQIDNKNNTYMAIKSAGGTATRAEIFGATTFLNGINMNGTALTNASNAGYTSTINPNGICIEFSNGFKIQFKRMDYTTRSTGFEGWTYPKPFSAIPYTFGNAARDDTLAANANIAFSNVNPSDCNVRISEKTNSYTILVCAIGF